MSEECSHKLRAEIDKECGTCYVCRREDNE